jgi:nucleoside-specific outer membrane channel protein Tsx
VRKHVLQFSHASGYAYGQNFLNLDVLQSDKNDPSSGGDTGATEFYLTYRHQLHLGKLLDKDLSFGPVKEVASPPASTSTPRTPPSRRASAWWWRARR